MAFKPTIKQECDTLEPSTVIEPAHHLGLLGDQDSMVAGVGPDMELPQ